MYSCRLRGVEDIVVVKEGLSCVLCLCMRSFAGVGSGGSGRVPNEKGCGVVGGNPNTHVRTNPNCWPGVRKRERRCAKGW